MAWLSASVIDSKGRRGESRQEQLNRLSDISNEESEYQLPEIGPLAYLVDYLSEIGEAEVNGGHLSIIGWDTMRAWSEMTGTRLSALEALGIRRLSSAYANQYHKSEESSCPAPHLARVPARQEVESKMKSLFSMLRGHE